MMAAEDDHVEQLIAARRKVPASLKPTIQMRNPTLLVGAPRVDPEDTTTDVAATTRMIE
jgi:hypothetical protein